MAKLTKTSTPGIFRRHKIGCDGKGRCSCSYVVVPRHRGKQVKHTVATFGEAREIKGSRDSGDSRPTARIKVEVYYEDWITTYSGRTSQGFSENSRDEYKRVIKKHVLPKWGTWKLADVEPKDARKLFVDLRAAEISTTEIRKIRTALSAMFGTASEDDGLLRSNPILGVRIPGAPEEAEPTDERAKAMTREELGLILAAVPAGERLFFEFLAHTGLRISEVAGLRWEHVDLNADAPRLLVREQVYRGKRKKLKSSNGRRDLPLSPGMAARLLAHRRDTYKGERASVFPSSGTARTTPDGHAFPFDSKKLAKDVLIPAREAIGMDWVTFHSFRHTCASLLFAADRNIKQVQEWLGHGDPSFTLRTYVHLMDEGVGDAGFLDDAVVPAGGNGGNAGATRPPQTAENAEAVKAP